MRGPAKGAVQRVACAFAFKRDGELGLVLVEPALRRIRLLATHLYELCA